jgi:hypothetical protein
MRYMDGVDVCRDAMDSIDQFMDDLDCEDCWDYLDNQ